MTTPVQGSSPTAISSSSAPPSGAPGVPPGIGAAPTTIESAQGGPSQPGYVLTFIRWATSWISWIFQTVVCCFCCREASL
ncbi:MAG: hypothetical protein KGQ49_01820, partial [Verrucomicrobia bacterium]|nr:hypothetical protein [Verrucomicrobiota bacterium]